MCVRIIDFMTDMGLDSYDDIGFLYQDYITECNTMVDSIDRLMGHGSPNEIEKLIHNFKGVSANLYVTSVYESAKTLNDLLRDDLNLNHVTPETTAAWIQLHQVYKNAKIEIIQFFEKEQVIIED